MKIGTLSSQTGLGIHTIRYYEKQGLIRKPNKDESGHRAYSSEDAEILNWISCMKHSGMSLSKIKTYTQAFYNNDDKTCTALLEEHLTQLFDQQENIRHFIEVTQNKITRFKNA